MRKRVYEIARKIVAVIAVTLIGLALYALFSFVFGGSIAERASNMQSRFSSYWQNFNSRDEQNEDTEIKIEIDQSALSQSSDQLAQNAENLSVGHVPIDPSVIFLGNGELTEICEKELPENIHIVIAETKDYRLGTADIAGLPCEVQIAIWPDSALTLSESNYLLINPATLPMEYYYIQSPTADVENFYAAAMPHAAGLFIRRGGMLIENPNLRELVIRQMGAQKKGLVIWEDELVADYQTPTTRHAVPLAQIDYVLTGPDVAQQWNEITQEARRLEEGEKLFVLMEAEGDNIDILKASIARP